MSRAESSGIGGLPVPLAYHINRVCDGHEAAWRAGRRPRIEDVLTLEEAPERTILLRELLAVELEARRRAGEAPDRCEYRDRFPAEAGLIEAVFAEAELHQTMGTSRERPASRAASSATLFDSRPTGSDAEPGKFPHIPGYEILGVLGRGGMGVVYRAIDEKRGVVVALKTLQRVDPAALLRFKQEFRALADVAHPNLVTLFELTAVGEFWFFTMELVEGVDFLTSARSGTDPPIPQTAEGPRPSASLSPGSGRPAQDSSPETLVQPHRGLILAPAALAQLRSLLRQLAEGVSALHEAGRLHRDLKPSNVLVSTQGRVVILDFGLAAELGPSGLHQSAEPYLLGTVSYMAPEQAAGQPVSTASDWYCVGSILYRVLTGRPPFLGRPFEVLRDKQRFEPPAPCDLIPHVPDDLNDLCVDLLRRDREARPTGREVLRRLGRIAGAPEPAVAHHPTSHQPAPFVGRTRQLEFLEAAFADMCRGQAVACYIHGPSGAGKTALVRRFLDDRVGQDRAVVLTGRCYEQESVPYKALDGVVDALGRYLRRLPLPSAQALLPDDIRSLVRLFPTLEEAQAVATAPRRAAEVPDPQELRRRAFQALRELMACLGDRHPLVVAIDDLQWGDVDSALLLSELLRPPDAPQLLLLGCYRSEDAATSPVPRALREVQGARGPRIDRRVLALSMLEPAEAETLARALLDREDPAARAQAAAIARESGGIPLFVAELVRYLQADSGVLDRVPQANDLVLDEVLWARVRRLPEDARRLLEVVAVSGRPLGRAEASRAAELGAGDHTVFHILRSGRLIGGTSPAERDEIETYHDRVREAVAARIPPGALEDHHRRLAQVLESSGRADPEVLAVHFQGAGKLERAGTYYGQAAVRASEALAFDRAAKLFRLALELRPGDEAESLRLRIGLADALANAGRGPEAAREYLATVAGASAAELLERRRLAAMQFLMSGHIDEGLAELRSVLGLVGITPPSTPRRAVLSLLLQRLRLRFRGYGFRLRDSRHVAAEDLTRIDICWAATRGLGFIDPIRGADFQARGLLLALRAGEPYRLVRALAMEAIHVSSAGGPSDRRVAKLLHAAEEIAHQLDDPYIRGSLILAGGWRPI
jgi:serine/threonine protein kinase